MIVPFECPQCTKQVEGERNPDSNRAVCPQCGQEVAVPLGIVPGVTLGNGYRIEQKLEETRIGDTYLALQVAMQRRVVIKTLSPAMVCDAERLGRFLREAKLTGSLRHPHILSAIDAGADSGIYFLVTEYRPGITLGEYLATRGGTLEEKTALRLLMPIAEALQHAWKEKKILHRNVKPDNILITEEEEPLLMDLGIAKSLEDDSMNLTGADFTVGTPEYMSPEQVQGEEDIDFRSDMYSLGITLYRCVVGTLPFEESNPIALMTKQLEEAPVPACEANPAVSVRCSALIDRLLRKERESRPATWQSLIDDMRALAAGKAATSIPAAGKPVNVAAKKSSARAGGGAGAGALGGGRITRKDVEQIASIMQKKPSVGTKMVLYMIAIAVPLIVGALIYVGIQHRRAPRPAPTGVGPAVPDNTTTMQPASLPTPPPSTSTTVARTDPADAPAGGKEAGMFKYAVDYYKQNSTDYEGAVRRFDLVREQTAGTKFALMASDMVEQIKADKAAAVAQRVASLRDKADGMAADNEFGAAIAMVEIDDGPFAEETAQARSHIVAALRLRQTQSAAELRQQSEQMARKVEELRQEIAGALLSGKAPVAVRLATQALSQPDLVAAAPDIAGLQEFASSVVKRDQLLLDAFQGMTGRKVKVRLQARGSMEIIVKEVEGGFVKGEKVVMDAQGNPKGTIAFRFTPAELQPKEQQIDILRSANPPYCQALCALIALELGKRDLARAFLQRDGDDPVSRLLLKHLGE